MKKGRNANPVKQNEEYRGASYRFQTPCQNPLCGALDVAAVALEVPQDAPSLDLREHLLYPLHRHLS